jgi:arginase family enzyme
MIRGSTDSFSCFNAIKVSLSDLIQSGLHLDLDGAWPRDLGNVPRIDLRRWGPRLRFTARRAEIEVFSREIAPAISGFPYLLFGSGDFHHLSALWLRRFVDRPMVLVSFDSHPDWDVRPPRWACGGWINRALEMAPALTLASVWGLSSFEYWWPGRLFANHGALRRERLEVHAWADERRGRRQPRLLAAAIRPADWRDRFSTFAHRLAGTRVYVTIDMDCLRGEDAVTNWESGRFAASDLVWAIAELRAHSKIVGGDLCGAWSAPVFARRTQALASRLDHPRLPGRDADTVRAVNLRAFHAIWPALTG